MTSGAAPPGLLDHGVDHVLVHCREVGQARMMADLEHPPQQEADGGGGGV